MTVQRARSLTSTENPHSGASYGLLAMNQRSETFERNSSLRPMVASGETSHLGNCESQGLKEK